MPTKTNFNQSPYSNDYDAKKDYYEILFKPGVSVQVRELNQLQTILKNQIERFGDNIFKQGTVISGCNFLYYPNYSYIKIRDLESDNTPAIPSSYVNYIVTNQSSGLRARVINYEDGFEATDPDLKTLYLNYMNSGNNYTTNAFTSGDVLRVSDFDISVHKIIVNDGSTGFSNSDSIVVTSAMIVNVDSGAFTNGEYITNNTANLQIVGIDTDTLAATSKIILSLKPKSTDLANATVNTSLWTLANGDSIRNVSNTVTGTIEGLIGSGLTAVIVTNGIGKITEFEITDGGSNYTTSPTVSVISSNNAAGIASLNVAAQNYLANIVVSSVTNSVGTGYAFGVTDGIIYQRGHFLRVANQITIVDKYSNSPNSISVGFRTEEDIIDSDIDPSLLDNSFIDENENAAGADRLKLVPTLEVMDSNEIVNNPEFLPLVQFSEGNAFRINQNTEYNKINDEMARRTMDESGNYVLDPFLISTRSSADANNEGRYFSVLVDAGKAYVSGYRVETTRNFAITVEKGIDTKVTNNQTIGLNYGNYIMVNNLAGIFQFSTGDTVKLYNNSSSYLANASLYGAGTITPSGTLIGTARARCLMPEIGYTDRHRLYLFDIAMNTGKNFRDVKSIYYDGTYKGIADTIRELDATTNTNITVIKDANNSSLIFRSGVEALKNANNITYVYRTIDQTTSTANTGVLQKDVSSSPEEFFPFAANLNTTQLKTLMVVPVGNNLIYTANVDGTAEVNATSNAVIGTGTAFTSNLEVGDYVYISPNTSTYNIRRVSSITNATHFTVVGNFSFANNTCEVVRTYPKNIPVPFGYREGLTANVDSNNNILTLDFGGRFRGSTSVNTAIAVDIERVEATQLSKTPNRNKFVMIRVANNAGGLNGPWCVGVPDVFRLRNVYMHSNSSVNTSSDNMITNFYIDHNQTADYYDLSYLYLKPKSGLTIDANTYLLVEFDYFTSPTGGFFDTVSYVSANLTQRTLVDSQPLSNLSSTVNSFEIPELYTANGTYYDLMNVFDFRPLVANTVTPNSNSASAPLNPANTRSFGNTADPTNDKKFPLPNDNMTVRVEEFMGRYDAVYVTKEGNITVGRGIASATEATKYPPNIPSDAMKITEIKIPAYPNIQIVRSQVLNRILATNVSNETYLKKRLDIKTISRATERGRQVQQPLGYDMADIENIDRRLKNVEYYLSLNLLESDLKNRVIPSSSDPSLNRFKYGFFVDAFENYNYSERDNPQYSVYIEDNCIVPEKLSWVVFFQPFLGPLPFIDEKMIRQENCTVGRDDETPPCVPDTLIANTYAYRLASDGSALTPKIGNTVSSWTDSYNLQLASANNGATTLYFYNYDTFSKIEIYQGNNIVATSNDATSLTTSERTLVVSNTVSQWFNDQPNTYLQNVQINGDGYAKYAGKITWTHRISNGRNYTIKVHKGAGARSWRYFVEYPIDRLTVGCPTPPPPPVNVWTSTGYIAADSSWYADGGSPATGCGGTSGADAASAGGGGDSGGGGGKIICTALNQMTGAGGWRNLLWLKYAETNYTAEEYSLGYHKLFGHLVRKMPTNRLIYKSMKWLADVRTDWIKGKLNDENASFYKKTRAFVLRNTLMPIIYMTGMLVKRGYLKKVTVADIFKRKPSE